MTQFYLSFCDTRLPTDEQFLGAVIVPADSFEEAVQGAHVLAINPGGEVCGHRIMDPDTNADIEVPLEFVGKLLRHPELDRLSDWAVGLLS